MSRPWLLPPTRSPRSIRDAACRRPSAGRLPWAAALMRTAGEGLQALADALAAEGGTLADVVRAPASTAPGDPGPSGHLQSDHRRSGASAFAGDAPGPAQLAASGTRARGNEDEYQLLLEMVREGVLLHYGEGRVTPSDDPDLALLLGDQLYALGLSRLAAIGDLEAVTELADMISLIAQANAAAAPSLAEATWETGAVAVGWGGDALHETAKAQARVGAADAATLLRQSAARLTRRQ